MNYETLFSHPGLKFGLISSSVLCLYTQNLINRRQMWLSWKNMILSRDCLVSTSLNVFSWLCLWLLLPNTLFNLKSLFRFLFYHILPHFGCHFLYPCPSLNSRCNALADLWSVVWKKLLPSECLGPAAFPWAPFSWESFFILSKAFVWGWKLTDARAIRPGV